MAEVSQIFAANHIIHSLSNRPDSSAAGHQGIRQLVAAFRSALPDFKLTVDDMVGQWNKVAVQLTIQGTPKDEPLGSAPTGQPITLNGMMIHHITNGKITETWLSHDLLCLNCNPF